MQKFKSISDPKITGLLKSGAVGVLPSDTVYGVMADASNQQAVAKLYKLKSRENKPGTIIAANIDQLVKLGVQRSYLKAVEQFWPGSVSIIIPTDDSLQYLHLGKSSLACRIPNHPEIHRLLTNTGPLLTTSANTPGDDPANTIEEAVEYFKEEVDFYVDGGDLSNNKPSTIIRVVDDAVEVIRPGAVKIDEASGSIVS